MNKELELHPLASRFRLFSRISSHQQSILDSATHISWNLANHGKVSQFASDTVHEWIIDCYHYDR